MREKLDDDDDVYKELYIKALILRCALCFCVVKSTFFFSCSFSETKLIVEFRVRQMENVRSEREKQSWGIAHESFFQSARLPERSFVLRSNKSTANNESFT